MIIYIDRESGEKREEQVFGEGALKFLYGTRFGSFLLPLICRFSLFSKLYGWWQKQWWTKGKVEPFIERYQVDSSEFAKTSFTSFNDFFIRELKPEARPLSKSDLVIPADGRYWFYENVDETDHFIVKGQKFSLQNASRYKSMMIARLCPTDYHRFHFPCDCIPGETRLINGPLYSVNPIAIRKNLQLLVENKRCITTLETAWGPIEYIEIGATCVGTIHQTYKPHTPYKKGDEKGYFSFGGSALILLFENLSFAKDLTLATKSGYEIRCLLGQSLT